MAYMALTNGVDTDELGSTDSLPMSLQGLHPVDCKFAMVLTEDFEAVRLITSSLTSKLRFQSWTNDNNGSCVIPVDCYWLPPGRGPGSNKQ